METYSTPAAWTTTVSDTVSNAAGIVTSCVDASWTTTVSDTVPYTAGTDTYSTDAG